MINNDKNAGYDIAALYGCDIGRAPGEVIKWLQSEKLSRLVSYAYKSVPFYKRRLDEAGVLSADIRSVNDLTRLPLLDAADIADCYPFGMFAVSREKQSLISIYDLPGSAAGHIAAAYTDEDIGVRYMCVSRALGSIGARSSDIVQLALEGWNRGSAAMLIGGIRAFGATVIPDHPSDTVRLLNNIKELGVDILCCAPETAGSLGKLVSENSLTSSLRLRAIILCGGSWKESDRAAIETSLGAKVYAMEGFSDLLAPCFAWECAMQDGLHISEDLFCAEVVDPASGKPMPDGVRGELVVTPLIAGAFPLLRFRTHKMTALTRFECACGRTTARLSRPVPAVSAADEKTETSVTGVSADSEKEDYTDFSDFSFLPN